MAQFVGQIHIHRICIGHALHRTDGAEQEKVVIGVIAQVAHVQTHEHRNATVLRFPLNLYDTVHVPPVVVKSGEPVQNRRRSTRDHSPRSKNSQKRVFFDDFQ